MALWDGILCKFTNAMCLCKGKTHYMGMAVSSTHVTGKGAWTQNPNEGLGKGIEGKGSKFMDLVSGRSGDCLDQKPGLLLWT